LRYGEMLSEAIDDGLTGRRPMDEALAGYERARNESAMPVFDHTCRLAELRPAAPRTKMLLGAIASSQAVTDRFLGLTAGTVLAPDFFHPDNIARITSGVTGAAGALS